MSDNFSDITANKNISNTTTQISNKDNAIAGPILEVTIHVSDWEYEGDCKELFCGAFEIAACDFSGPPDRMSIKGVSTPLSSSLRREEKCRAWESVTLRNIAEDIAKKSSMSLMYEVKDDIKLDRVDQLQKSDLIFLQSLCHDYGISVKVTNKNIVLFEEKDYEERDSIASLNSSEIKTENNPFGRIISYSFSQDTSDGVEKVICSYKDPKSGKLVKGEFTPPNPPSTGQKQMLNTRPADLRGDAYRNVMNVSSESSGNTFQQYNNTVGSFDDIRADTTGTVERKAQAAAREKNKFEWTCSLTMVGNVNFVGGCTFELIGWGVYSGKYIIDEATHKIGGGYQTTIKAHKVLGY